MHVARGDDLPVYLCWTGLYTSFRNTRDAAKLFKYRKLFNESSDSHVRASLPQMAHKLRPTRPPQPKSVSVPEGDDSLEGLLIDLTEVTLAPSQTRPGGSPQSDADAVSLIDSSISEKYSYLPPPLGEKSKDPFEVNLGGKTWMSHSGTASLNASVMSSRYSSDTNQSVLSSLSLAGQALSGTLPAPASAPTSMPLPLLSPLAAPIASRVSEAPSSGAVQQTDTARPVKREQATLQGNSPPEPAVSRGSPPGPDAQDPGGPPLPPRYANIPSEDALKLKKPPPVPDKLKAMKILDHQEPQSSKVPLSVEQAELDFSAGISVGNSRFYDKVEEDVRLYDEVAKESPNKHVYSEVGPNSVNLNVTHSKPDVHNVNKAFDWLNDSISGFSSDKQRSSDEQSKQKVRDTGVLETQEKKSRSTEGPPDTKPKVWVNAPLKMKKSNSASSSQASCADDWGSDWGDDWGDDFDDTNDPPALPPRDFVSDKNLTQTDKSKDTLYRNLPRILPVYIDGQRVSKDHYFVIPSWYPAPKTAEVRPFAVGGCQLKSDAGRQSASPYQNINSLSQRSSETQSTKSSPKRQGAPASHKGAVGGACGNTWSHLTGLKAISPGEKPTVALKPGVRQAAGKTTEGYEGSPQAKVAAVQREVHGVTQEESQAALANNGWSITAAIKYLKIEQLFRIGIASRERCQKLLETFQWNLEMSGSVLLDEIAVGSSVWMTAAKVCPCMFIPIINHLIIVTCRLCLYICMQGQRQDF